MSPDHLELGNCFVKIFEKGQNFPAHLKSFQEESNINGVDWDEARALVIKFKEQRRLLQYKVSIWHKMFHIFTARWVGTSLVETCYGCGKLKQGVRRAQKIS